MADICASVQDRIVSILIKKLEKAAQQCQISTVAIAGGVSANSGLRRAIMEKGSTLGWSVHIPKMEYCTDNAAMIAVTAYYKYLAGELSGQDAVPVARWGL